MHSLSIVFGNGHAVVWTLMFRDEAKAEAARVAATSATDCIDITDAFGQRVTLAPKHVVGVMLEDLSLSKLCHVERAIHHAHIQSDAQIRAESDSKLRIARNMQGPAMISPMPNGRMG